MSPVMYVSSWKVKQVPAKRLQVGDRIHRKNTTPGDMYDEVYEVERKPDDTIVVKTVWVNSLCWDGCCWGNTWDYEYRPNDSIAVAIDPEVLPALADNKAKPVMETKPTPEERAWKFEQVFFEAVKS